MAMIRINIQNINSIAIKQQTLKSNLNQIKENIRSNKNGLDFEISKRGSISNSFDNLYTKVDFISRDIEKLESILNLTVSQYTEAESKIKANIYNNFGNIHNKKSCPADILKQKFINNNIFEQLSNLNVDNVFINESDNNKQGVKNFFKKLSDFYDKVGDDVDYAIEYTRTLIGTGIGILGEKLGNIRFEIRGDKVIVFGNRQSKEALNILGTRYNLDTIKNTPHLNKVFNTSKIHDSLNNMKGHLKNISTGVKFFGYTMSAVGAFFEYNSEENIGKDVVHKTTDVVVEAGYNIAKTAIATKVGTWVGGAIGSIIPGAGTVAGAIIGGAIGMVGSVFVSEVIDFVADIDRDKDDIGLKDELKEGIADGVSDIVNWTKNLFEKGNGNGKLNFSI